MLILKICNIEAVTVNNEAQSLSYPHVHVPLKLGLNFPEVKSNSHGLIFI